MPTIDLNDASTYRRYDPDGMMGHISRMPDFCTEAWEKAMAFDLPAAFAGVNKILILGMGGSAIGGDLLNSYVIDEALIPIILQRDFTLPAFVDERTLVIASSCSGQTEETLAAFRTAIKTGAKKLAITTGGSLISLARDAGIPVFEYHAPGPPRTALPFSFIAIMGFLQKLGVIGDRARAVAAAIETLRGQLQTIEPAVPLAANPAKSLATRLSEKLPVIYGAGVLAQVAHRWKTQFNENSKTWAFYDFFPELNHNAVSGYEFPPAVTRQTIIVMLRSTTYSPVIQERYRLTGRLLEGAGIRYEMVDGKGTDALSHVLSTVLLGDYTSYYLAMLNKTDPTPTKNIDFLKQKSGEPGPARDRNGTETR